VVLVGDRSAEDRHDPVSHHLVDRTLVAVHGLHHVLKNRIEKFLGFFGIKAGQQCHGSLEVGKENRDLLALSGEDTLFGEYLLGEISGNGRSCWQDGQFMADLASPPR